MISPDTCAGGRSGTSTQWRQTPRKFAHDEFTAGIGVQNRLLFS